MSPIADFSQKPFIIYKSSAGSGKTYTLTLEYLKLALQDVYAYRNILAVTFTNKATQEMKERIIEVLERLCHRVDPQEKLDGDLLTHLAMSSEQLKARASLVLTEILHHYADFSVSTIDSFFQRVVRAFAREIDLQAKFDIEMDNEAVLDRLIERVVEKVQVDGDLRKWLVAFAESQIQEGGTWDIRKNMATLGKQLFEEDFKASQREIKNFLADSTRLDALKTLLDEQRRSLIDQSLNMKQRANEIRERYGLQWTDFAGGSRSFTLKFDKLGDKNEPYSKTSPTMLTAIDDTSKWHKKSDPNETAILAAYTDGLGQILGQIPAGLMAWNTLQAVYKNFYVFGVIRHLLEELQALKADENIVMISDANEFLKEITRENEAPFVYEKVGTRFKHFLIDEFQDTSGFQWESFKPLLENSLAEGNTNLLVGDVKQSIYRWRGGEMKLLLEGVEEQMGSAYIENKNLDTNFRSLPNVVHFNNALFELLPSVMEDGVRSKIGVELDTSMLSRAYEAVHQKVSSRKQAATFQGMVKLEFVQKSAEAADKNEEILERIPAMLRSLQDHGYALRDIAILVRKKSEGQLIADALMKYAAEHVGDGYHYDVLSDEAMSLSKAAVVKCLLAAMKYLWNQADQVQMKTMWYYRELIKGAEPAHELFDIESIPVRLLSEMEHFDKMTDAWRQLPLLELVEVLTETLDLQDEPKERAYLSGFKEAIYDFVGKQRSDLGEFLIWWEDNSDKRTVKIPEGHDALRILTIHKSKGLQFKAVLMPFMTWEIVNLKNSVTWAPYPCGLEPMPVVPISLTTSLLESHFADYYVNEVLLNYLDSLNMIYVALTRAEEIFWGLIPDGEKNTNSIVRLEDVFKRLLSSQHVSIDNLNLSEGFDASTGIYQLGEWPNQGRSLSNPLPPVSLQWRYRHWTSLLEVKTYAVDFSAEGLEQRNKRNYGLLIHELLEKARYREDIKGILQSYFFDGKINTEEMENVEQQLDQLFKNPLFASWFDTRSEVMTEQGILLPDGKQKRPDRVIVQPSGATVVDFKTGGEKAAYNDQVKEYMQLIKELLEVPVKGYLCYLETGTIKEVN